MQKYTQEQLEANFDVLASQVELLCPELVDLLRMFKYGEASLDDTENDAVAESEPNVGQKRFAGFIDAPAGKGMHHHYAGGLVEHLIEMIEIADYLIKVDCENPINVSFNDAVRVIVLHDLHKAYRTFWYNDRGDGFDYAEHVSNEQLTHNQKSLWMLARAAPNAIASIVGNMSIMNALFSSEGGYAKDAPREQSVLAKLCYLCDELSVVQNRNSTLNRLVSSRARQPEYFKL